jgi:hypothetical protein
MRGGIFKDSEVMRTVRRTSAGDLELGRRSRLSRAELELEHGRPRQAPACLCSRWELERFGCACAARHATVGRTVPLPGSATAYARGVLNGGRTGCTTHKKGLASCPGRFGARYAKLLKGFSRPGWDFSSVPRHRVPKPPAPILDGSRP